MLYLSMRRSLGKKVGKVGCAIIGTVALLMTATGCGTDASAETEPTEGTAVFDKNFTHGKVDVDGAVLHYVKGGSGAPLVLLHGWPQTWWTWHKVMPDLAKTHTVIAIDLPGFGDSTVPKDGYDKATTARRVHQAVSKLGYQQVQIMGHDLGAAVAYDYARDFPSEVTRMTVIEMPLPGFGMEQTLGMMWPTQLNSMPAPLTENIINNDGAEYYNGWVLEGGAWHPEAVDKKYFINAYNDPERRHAGYEYTRAFPADAADNKANATAKQLKIPVLVMAGDHGIENIDLPGLWRGVAADVRGAAAPDAGHFVQEEAPRFLADCAGQFFGGPAVAGLPTGCNP
jgi:pimeloyl-ACP methyl ester carboxylesterase